MRFAFFVKRISESNAEKRQQISPQVLLTNFRNHAGKQTGKILGSFVPDTKKQQIAVNLLGIVAKV